MQFTTTTILAAFIATVSAAAVPSATALQPLPEKFTLVFTSSGTALDKFSHDITIDIAFGDTLYIGPNTNEEQIHVEFVSNGTSASTTPGDHRYPYPLVVSAAGQALLADNYLIPLQGGSYGQINGAFGFKADTGIGPPTALWAACAVGLPVDLWTLSWNRPDCVPIGVKVVPV